MNKQHINPAAAQGYESGAEFYETGRPDYPPKALDCLITSLRIGAQSKVLDLGAGTGKFTRLLVSTKATLVAVEPVDAMRNKFISILPDVEVLFGTAENIPAPDESFDAVVVAQAFHWFNGDLALKEICRILKPNGSLGLIWNARDESVNWVSELTKIINAHEADAPRYRTNEWKKAFDRTTDFTTLEKRSFKHIQKGNAGTVIDRVRSTSFISALPQEEHETVLRQVKCLLDDHPQTKNKDIINIPYTTDVYWCSKTRSNFRSRF